MHGKEKMFSCQKIDDKHFTSITTETEINYVNKSAKDDLKSGGYNIRPGLADATNDVMKKRISEGHVPSGNEKRYDLTDDMRGTLTLVRSTESGLTSHLDEKARVINNNLNLVSTKTKDDHEVIVGGQYRDKDPTICFASKDDGKRPPQQKEIEIGLLTLDVSEQIFGYYNNADKGSHGPIGVSELEKVQSSSGLCQAVGRNDNGLEADTVAEQQRTKGCLFVPNVNDQAYTCNLKELRQDRGQSSVPQPLYNKQRSNVTDLNVSYLVDSTHTKSDAGIMTGTGQKSCSYLLSGIEQKSASKNNVPGVGSGSVHEPKQKKSSLENLFGVSASEQTYVKNNLNVSYAGTVQEGPGLEGFKNAKNNEIMIGFGNHACPSDDAITEYIWKTDDENGLLADLAETSSQLLHPLHYPPFDVRANKVQVIMTFKLFKLPYATV
ncbi:hypothetical protein SLEP1_g20868 [Rubroshorea leprosula]|uniref:Uncharacterized protein n=1 Tax=Rubroshorea leprosula TaxID=152421 RepID=A0AAV5J9Z2_9ROSI|nr:hypothetical protein SLEP1_g20868 [Rubroshorea leprosula]